MKGGGLIELPKLKQFTYTGDVDHYSYFERIDGSKKKIYELLIDPALVQRVPVVDGNEIEAIIVSKGMYFQKLATVHQLGDYLDDPYGRKWRPINTKPPFIKENWPSLFMLSRWGMSDRQFRLERGPHGLEAYHIGKHKWRVLGKMLKLKFILILTH